MTWADVATISVGLGAGLLSGAIGVGGGIIFVPFMTVGLRVHQTLAQGTSLLAIIPTATTGGITHWREGNTGRQVAIWMGGGGVLGALLGAGAALYIPQGILARVFAAFLLVSALRIAWGARKGTPPVVAESAEK